jgi:hypothetical protein
MVVRQIISSSYRRAASTHLLVKDFTAMKLDEAVLGLSAGISYSISIKIRASSRHPEIVEGGLG